MLKNLKQEQHFVLIYLKMPDQIKSSSEKLLKVTLSQRRCSEPAMKLLLTYLSPHVDLCVEACVADRLTP